MAYNSILNGDANDYRKLADAIREMAQTFRDRPEVAEAFRASMAQPVKDEDAGANTPLIRL